MPARRILLVDADPETAPLISRTLEQAGYTIAAVANCAAALAAMRDVRPELVISNATSAGADGIDLTNALRPFGVPILLLTMRDVLYNREAILERARLLVERVGSGATARHVVDRLDAPVGAMARSEAAVRPFRSALRARTGGDFPASPHAPQPMIALERGDSDVYVNGHTAHLTRTEFGILSRLIAADGACVTYDALLQDVWGAPYRGARHLLQVHLQRLRLKLAQAGAPRDIIRNRWRVGYAVDAVLSEGWAPTLARQRAG